MQLSDFDFPFDPNLVAAQPVEPRDRARLLVLERATGALTHRHVADLPSLLHPGDLLVLNDTKVVPARITGITHPTGKPVEVLFVKDLGGDCWEVMAKGNLRVGQILDFGPGARATIVQRDAAGTRVKVQSRIPVRDILYAQGSMPLPPYIKRPATDEDRRWYQTVFAKHEGAIAAPTAGLHFTPEVLAELERRGIGRTMVTLHVGPGTFKPVTTERIEDHRMGAEAFEIGEETARAVERTKHAGRRVVAVGTTVVRALETAAAAQGRVVPMAGDSTLFITPGFRFQAIDALMTNFHLPKTTLLMLVSALAGLDLVRKAYEEAVCERYRFYSYGDAMLIV
jgi:S-adenosylmethionine:tRNA ribosyltransferase-isomerase